MRGLLEAAALYSGEAAKVAFAMDIIVAGQLPHFIAGQVIASSAVSFACMASTSFEGWKAGVTLTPFGFPTA